MKIIAAPGPVSYPLILATKEYRDLDLVFGKGGEEGNAYAIADSLTSLIKNNLRIDIITVKRLMVIYPELRGPRIGVWRRGSAADILTRALIGKVGLGAEIVYADDWYSLSSMLSRGEVDSAVLSLGIVDKGVFLEDAVNAPGACGAQINGDPQYFIDVYNTGIRIARENPVDSADYVVSKLPIKLPRDFVLNILRRVDYGIYSPGDISGFIRLVRSYVDKP